MGIDRYQVTGICPQCYAEVDANNMEYCPQCGYKLHQEWPFSAEETAELLEEMEG